jgi:type VI secretion system secreted protein VgrG
VHPALWRAGLRVNARIFQHLSVTEIVDTLLKENGIRDCVYTLGYAHPPREFCVQYDESDLAFLQRLLADEGIFYYFEFHQGKNGRTLFFADACMALGNRFSVPYNPVPDPRGAQPSINQFRWREQVGLQRIFLKDRTFKNPPWGAEYHFSESKTGHQRTDLPSYTHYDFPGRYKDERGEKMSRYRLEALRRNDFLGHGQSDCFFLWPGLLFTLTGHPKAKFNVPWQVLQIRHHGTQPQADDTRTGETGTTLTNHFTFGDRSRSWRPSPYPKPRIDGLQIATVVGPAGEEIFCDEYGRVRVQFAWDRYGEFNDHSSCWIRVSQAWAGKGWGMMAIPRVGQEVLVDFLHGDPDQPIITGRAYHAGNLPPNRLPIAKTQMSLRSKTHKGDGFNELRFEDEKDREEVFIHAQKNLSIQVRNARDERVNYNRTTSIGNDDELAIARNRKITVDGQQAHKTTGNYIELIERDKNLEIKGDDIRAVGGALGYQAAGDITIKSDTRITLRVGSNFVVIHQGGVDIKGTTINLNSAGSPGDVSLPATPSVLKTAAALGMPFVAHCSAKE